MIRNVYSRNTQGLFFCSDDDVSLRSSPVVLDLRGLRREGMSVITNTYMCYHCPAEPAARGTLQGGPQ